MVSMATVALPNGAKIPLVGLGTWLSDTPQPSELPPCGNRPADVETWIKKSLTALQLDYIDLYLIHTPFAFEYVEGDMHPLDADGNIRFDNTTNHIDVEFCKSKGITVTAYCPIGNPGLAVRIGKSDVIPCILKNPAVIKIAEKYKKTPAQIALKFIIQHGIIAIPKSTNMKRLKENIDLFDFNINNDDLQTLISLDCGEVARVCDFTFFKGLKNHPEFPF